MRTRGSSRAERERHWAPIVQTLRRTWRMEDAIRPALATGAVFSSSSVPMRRELRGPNPSSAYLALDAGSPSICACRVVELVVDGAARGACLVNCMDFRLRLVHF